MSLASDLLEQAAYLAQREKQRPKQASLRRSISASYYALFHLLTGEAVSILGANLQPAATHKLQRWFDHYEMNRVCGMFAAPAPPRQIGNVLAGPTPDSLQVIAKAFVQLQQARIDADYNLTSVWTRLEAQEYLQLARTAFAAWNRVRRSHEANVFALALLAPKLFEKER